MRLSVVIPCKNEVAHIGQVLCDLANQSLTEVFEVVVADGLSDDGTREVLAKFFSTDLPYRLRVVDNPSRTISTGLNVAVAEASGEYIVRLDGHCRIPCEYLELIMGALQRPGKDVVGPATRYIPGDTTKISTEIALALNTRLGNGGTPSRITLRDATRVDHTVMSCYRREVWEAIGGYDEGLLSNEDFDFDYRANLRGFTVWSLSSPQYSLVARPSIRSLVRQRFRYGYWKWRVLKRHPRSLRARQLIPLLITMGITTAFSFSFWRPKLLILPLAYGSFLCLYSTALATYESSKPRWWRLPLIYTVIHLVWGIGLLWSVATQVIQDIIDTRVTYSGQKGRGFDSPFHGQSRGRS